MQKEVVENKERNAEARRQYALDYLRREGCETPADLILSHQEWLESKLCSLGVPEDNLTWRHLHDNSLARSLGKKVESFGPTRRRLEVSISNILKAIAWYYFPEHSSWEKPVITLPANEILVNQEAFEREAAEGRMVWYPPMESYKSYVRDINENDFRSVDAPYNFRINRHWEGIKGSFGFNNRKLLRGVEARFDHEKKLFYLNFENPNNFMGWEETKDGLEYKPTLLNELISSFSSSIKDRDSDIISVSFWQAY